MGWRWCPGELCLNTTIDLKLVCFHVYQWPVGDDDRGEVEKAEQQLQAAKN